MDGQTRRFVRERAAGRCEYCRLPQSASPFFTFHVEHVYAQQHITDNSPENLALACPHCNLHKGPNLSSIDSQTGEIIELFHPRRQAWNEHFLVVGSEVVGQTATRRVTVHLLQMNAEEQIRIREQARRRGEW